METALERVIARMVYDVATKPTNVDRPRCRFCQCAGVVKNGVRNGTQYYLRKKCGRGFVYNRGLPRMRYPIDIVTDAVYDCYAGGSLRKIVDGIEQKIRRTPADSTIDGWVKRLIKIALADELPASLWLVGVLLLRMPLSAGVVSDTPDGDELASIATSTTRAMKGITLFTSAPS